MRKRPALTGWLLFLAITDRRPSTLRILAPLLVLLFLGCSSADFQTAQHVDADELEAHADADELEAHADADELEAHVDADELEADASDSSVSDSAIASDSGTTETKGDALELEAHVDAPSSGACKWCVGSCSKPTADDACHASCIAAGFGGCSWNEGKAPSCECK